MRKLLFFTFAFFFTASMAFGQNNHATITQTGGAGVGADNVANIEQEHSGNQGTNVVTVQQQGVANKIRGFSQWGSGNTAELSQFNNNNVIRMWPAQGPQEHDPTGRSFGGEVTVTQRGQHNVLHDLDQIGWGNEAVVNQDGQDFVEIELQYSQRGGPGNAVSIFQSNGTGNEVGDRSGDKGVHQQGDNELFISQNAPDNRAGTKSLSEAGITDFGPNPLIGTGQESGETQSLVQAGSGNFLEIFQEGADVVEYALQNGSNNIAVIDQNGDAFATDQASLIQRGSNHVANITQENGSDNLARVTQSGAVHIAVIGQDGQGHTATIQQSNMNHSATVSQTGLNNTATVIQQ